MNVELYIHLGKKGWRRRPATAATDPCLVAVKVTRRPVRRDKRRTLTRFSAPRAHEALGMPHSTKCLDMFVTHRLLACLASRSVTRLAVCMPTMHKEWPTALGRGAFIAVFLLHKWIATLCTEKVGFMIRAHITKRIDRHESFIDNRRLAVVAAARE